MKTRMKIFRILLIVWFIGYLSNTIYSQPYPLLTNVEGRCCTSLNGNWKFLIDPMESGIGAKFYLDKEYTDKFTYRKYNFEEAETLIVPGDWNTQRPELLYYEGTIWYRKKFEYQLEKEKRFFLYFGAVNYESTVYLNGEELGKHVGGYTPFNFEITQKLRDGENSLVVKVSNKRHPDGVPETVFDWWNFGGITRSVILIEIPETFIRDYSLHLSNKDMNLIKGWVQLDGNKKNVQVNIEIPELKIRHIVNTDDSGKAMIEFEAKPEYWSPENPKLYSVNIISTTDEISENIGFRKIETQGKEILLNGEKTFLRGVNIHAQVYGRNAHSREDAALLLGWAKELGCNFVRLAHYPHSEEMIRVAEQMGVMVWEEIPVYWQIEWENPVTYANAENQLEEIITRDKNRANIVIWSIANETPQTDNRLTFLAKLVKRTRELDETRLVSSALSGIRDMKPYHKTLTDKLVDHLDVLSFNQYFGWFMGTTELCDKIVWEFNADKPLLMTEFGASAPFDMHGDKTEKYTEEYQESYYKHTIEMIKRIPDLSGACPWNLYEHRSPLRVMSKIEDGYSRAGLISVNGQKKKAFYVMKKWYEELADKGK
jgi:beta-glucuronidase